MFQGERKGRCLDSNIGKSVKRTVWKRAGVEKFESAWLKAL